MRTRALLACPVALVIVLCMLVGGCESLDAPELIGSSVTVTSSSASTSTVDEDIVGLWEPLDAMHESLIHFDADGVMTWMSLDTGEVEDRLSYRVEGDRLILTSEVAVDRIGYSIDGDVLTLMYDDGFQETFRRREAEVSSTQPGSPSTDSSAGLVGVWWKGDSPSETLAIYPHGWMIWDYDPSDPAFDNESEFRYRIDGDGLIVSDWLGDDPEIWDYYFDEWEARPEDSLHILFPDTGGDGGDYRVFTRAPLDVLLLGPWMNVDIEGEMAVFWSDGQAEFYEADLDQELEFTYTVDDGFLVITEWLSGSTLIFPYSLKGVSTEDLYDDLLEITDPNTAEVTTYRRYSP